MKSLFKLATALLLSGTSAVFAHGYQAGPINIDHPWSRATAPVATTGVVYFVLHNPGPTKDRLIAASSPAADKVELHTHIHDGDMVRMRKLNAIDLAPASTVALKPGGLHIMLIDLKRPLVKGKAFPLTLVFEEAGPVTVQVDVQGITDTAPAHTSNSHNHSHSGH